jgi:ABC-type nitrate/sulfonate/bicarbonate transport system substrate-binding protein
MLVTLHSAAAFAAPPVKVRIGWQTTWATQGQLTVILMRTDILARHGLAGEFKGFSYGGPLNEAAVAGQVDVLFTADQPALMLAARSPQWGAIGRLMYNRVGMFVAPGSAVRKAADLRNKTLAVPFGAAAQREAIFALRSAGIEPGKDVKLVNLGIEEIVALARAGSKNGRWGEIDAAAAWDPAFANLEHSRQARTIASTQVISLVMADQRFVAANPGVAERFMLAMAAAYDYYRKNRAEADRWFQEESKLPFEREVLTIAASVEPNLSAKSDSGVRVWLNAADVAALRKTSAFMTSAGLLKAPLDVTAVLRPSATTPTKR